MTQNPLTPVASAVVLGVLMSASALGAQTVTTAFVNIDAPESPVRLGRSDDKTAQGSER